MTPLYVVWPVSVCRAQGYIAPASDPDSMRWGKGEGCDFITGSVASWSQRYFCQQPASEGCTYDNRMAAVCTIATGITAPQSYSWVDAPGATTPTMATQPSSNCIGSACNLPPMFQVRLL